MSDPKDLMWVITAAQIKSIKDNLGPMPYDKVERTLEVLSSLKRLSEYVPTEGTSINTQRAPIEEAPVVKKLKLNKTALTEEELLRVE